ncbi:DUF1854 domain-containing protein [Singulisphaera sp. PoT]|uniref:cyanophycin metabolism-associated DUF1854 family protein n=1 Tax=Singulisphaera sp. PoT TaxID=3411797 RepID=UPI003BF58ADF
MSSSQRNHLGSRTATASASIQLLRDDWDRLVLTDELGRDHVGVEPVRAFPLSDPERWISLCDGHGRELVRFETLEGLEPDLRRLVEEELSVREFVPTITRIVRVSGETSPSDWDVETDRGRTRFTLDSEDDVRRLGPHRILITDALRLRYHIPDMRNLDHASRRTLDRYL